MFSQSWFCSCKLPSSSHGRLPILYSPDQLLGHSPKFFRKVFVIVLSQILTVSVCPWFITEPRECDKRNVHRQICTWSSHLLNHIIRRVSEDVWALEAALLSRTLAEQQPLLFSSSQSPNYFSYSSISTTNSINYYFSAS